jgi:hypothetical protein
MPSRKKSLEITEAYYRRALTAHTELCRIAKHPERESAWPRIMADLAEGQRYYAKLDELTDDQALDYRRLVAALSRK